MAINVVIPLLIPLEADLHNGKVLFFVNLSQQDYITEFDV